MIDELLRFAGPAIEVRADRLVETEEPEREADPPAPVFLGEVVATGSVLTVRFRAGEKVPDDLILLMPDQRDRDRSWLLYRRTPEEGAGPLVDIALDSCSAVDQTLTPVPTEPFELRAMSPWIDVKWGGEVAPFPVRFDDKEALPPAPGFRRLSEGELIDYFMYGREPWESDDGQGGTGTNKTPPDGGPGVDTRRILSYFIRRFVEAIPGIEDDIARAWHSRPALMATLTGPTGVLALATEAARGVREAPRSDEPVKTPTAAGFQLVEIIATLQRCGQRAPTDEARQILEHAIQRCRRILADLETSYPELRESGFVRYRGRFRAE